MDRNSWCAKKLNISPDQISILPFPHNCLALLNIFIAYKSTELSGAKLNESSKEEYWFQSTVLCMKLLWNLLLMYILSTVDVLEGYNGTIFAYGQTSSGKTHTMEVRYY